MRTDCVSDFIKDSANAVLDTQEHISNFALHHSSPTEASLSFAITLIECIPLGYRGVKPCRTPGRHQTTNQSIPEWIKKSVNS